MDLKGRTGSEISDSAPQGPLGRKKRGMKAICLTSGGLDSTTCLAIAKKEGAGFMPLASFMVKGTVMKFCCQKVASFFKAENTFA